MARDPMTPSPTVLTDSLAFRSQDSRWKLLALQNGGRHLVDVSVEGIGDIFTAMQLAVLQHQLTARGNGAY